MVTLSTWLYIMLCYILMHTEVFLFLTKSFILTGKAVLREHHIIYFDLYSWKLFKNFQEVLLLPGAILYCLTLISKQICKEEIINKNHYKCFSHSQPRDLICDNVH